MIPRLPRRMDSGERAKLDFPVMRETALLFLKLGFLAFGGPSAHVAMLEDEVVERRGWISRQHFLDLVGATNLIPGPNSTQMMMHIGWERHGLPGLLAAVAVLRFKVHSLWIVIGGALLGYVLATTT